MTTSIRYLRMLLHTPQGRRGIGYLSQYGDILRVSFDKDYIDDASRPTLSLIYQGANEAATRAILTATRDARVVRADGHWPVYFENLLPEGANRTRLANERGCSPDNEFELLAAAGHDLPGAIEVEPVPPSEGIPDVVRNWHTAQGLDVLEPGFVEDPVEDAAALPGVVTKFSAVQHGRRYVVKRHGEAGDFILKLPSTRHPDLVENEFTGYRLCQALGITCAEATIITREEAELPEHIPFDRILAVKRFDRAPGGHRIHMEEFAQILGYPTSKKYGRELNADYGNMLRVLDAVSGRPAQDVQEFCKRFVAFILMGNTDAHLKNWAVVYPDGRVPMLAPLYDPVCVTAFFDDVPVTDYGINRAIDKTLREFSLDSLENLFRAAGLARASRLTKIAKDTVREAKSLWPEILAEAPAAVGRSVLERIGGGVALARA